MENMIFSQLVSKWIQQEIDYITTKLRDPALDDEDCSALEWEKKQYEEMLYYGNYHDYAKYGGSFEEVIVQSRKS